MIGSSTSYHAGAVALPDGRIVDGEIVAVYERATHALYVIDDESRLTWQASAAPLTADEADQIAAYSKAGEAITVIEYVIAELLSRPGELQ